MTEDKIPQYVCIKCKTAVNKKKDYETGRYFIPKGCLCNKCESYKDANKTLEELKKQPLCVKCKKEPSLSGSYHCHKCLDMRIKAIVRD